MGALSNLWLGDKLGRRKTIVIGGIIMIIGAILQATAFTYAHMIVARIVTGIGNGLNVGSHWFVKCRRGADLSRSNLDVNGTIIPRRMLPSGEEGELHYD